MDLAAFDFTEARNRMVDSQVRPNRVTDARIIAAMRDIPRELFLPARLRPFAYIDEDVPLGGGRVLMEPLAIARLIQLLAPTAGGRALVVAAGVGYGSAVLAACGVRVTALEEAHALLEIARPALEAVAPSVSLVAGPLAAGWSALQPYDLILLEGAVLEIPPAVAEQLRMDGGRLAAVVRAQGAVGRIVLAERTPLGLRAQPMFDCATPAIPSLLPKPGFVF
jgi:protein-L-isoaspartate(D-aspartate) O-methyltransferase